MDLSELFVKIFVAGLAAGLATIILTAAVYIVLDIYDRIVSWWNRNW